MSSPKRQKTEGGVSDFAVDTEDVASLLAKLIGHSKNLQNNPPTHVPQEDLAANEVLEYLKDVTAPKGPLVIKRCTYISGRSNLIITYPAAEETEKCLSFVGSHMDVVSAAAEDWDKDPFKMTREGDKVFGRGVTDCLGHVATLTCVMKMLGTKQPSLKSNITVVFIANEENSSIAGVGIDKMMTEGELDMLKHGPLVWVDSANFGPTLATAGMTPWKMEVHGKRFHSGIPQNGINPINLASIAITYIQKRFYEDFAMGEQEKKYKFQVGSSLKPTQVKTPPGSINQIPQLCTMQGDIRVTPFHKISDVRAKVEGYVKDFNAGLENEKGLGYETFVLEDARGKVEWVWPDPHPMVGVAVDLESPGFKALDGAITEVIGKSASFSLTGSLPLIAELKENGFDVQITGFGRMEAYHAINEFALLSELVQGSQIIFKVVAQLA